MSTPCRPGGHRPRPCSPPCFARKDSTNMTAAPGASAPPLDDFPTLVRQAQAGDRRVLPALQAHLDAHPEIWQARGNLAQQLKATLITKIAGAEQLATQEVMTRWWDQQVM